MSSAKDDVMGVERPLDDGPVVLTTRKLNRPLSFGVIVARALDSRLQPDVELHEAGIGLKPISQFILWGELRPVLGKGEVSHVRVFSRIVGDQRLHK